MNLVKTIDLTVSESDLELEDSFGPPVCSGSPSVDAATVVGQQAADYDDLATANSDTDDSQCIVISDDSFSDFR